MSKPKFPLLAAADLYPHINYNDMEVIEAKLGKYLAEVERKARVNEHTEHILPATEAAHAYEQNENGSGIQHFDNERLARLKSLSPDHKPGSTT